MYPQENISICVNGWILGLFVPGGSSEAPCYAKSKEKLPEDLLHGEGLKNLHEAVHLCFGGRVQKIYTKNRFLRIRLHR